MGDAWIASATIVAVGFTAYGWDSDPTYIAPISCGLISARANALLAASTAIVTVSSSGPGTDFSLTTNPFEIEFGSSPHTLAISSTLIL